MAALTYRCPVDPACPEATGPGFCSVHAGTRLERVRPGPAPTGSAPAQAASPPPATSQDSAPALVADSHLAVRILGHVVPVPPHGLLLGRETPDIRDLPGLADLLHVGRQHARLYWHDGDLHVVDLDSTNGTFVSGQRIRAPAALSAGQVIDLAGDLDVQIVELDEFGFPR
jgi:hypothetical protein